LAVFSDAAGEIKGLMGGDLPYFFSFSSPVVKVGLIVVRVIGNLLQLD
jgi:hypothetical protein